MGLEVIRSSKAQPRSFKHKVTLLSYSKLGQKQVLAFAD
jgi:hypothetical protein